MTNRPRKRKRDLILSRALEVFVRRGYEGASIDEIAEAAGVSRQTIYNNFVSKEALFKALIEALVTRMLDPLFHDDAPAPDVRTMLIRLGEQSLRVMMRPKMLELHRLLVAEAPKFPELSRHVYEAGAMRTSRELGAYLLRQKEAGALRIENPEVAAEQFFGMLIGPRHYRALVGVSAGMSDEEIRQVAETTTETFLKAWGR